MNNNNDTTKTPRKTLTAGKLSLNKPVNLEVGNIHSTAAKNTRGVRTSVAVEVKKNLTTHAAGQELNKPLSQGNFSNSEVENRIKLLQNAATENLEDQLKKEQLRLQNEEIANKKNMEELLVQNEAAVAAQQDNIVHNAPSLSNASTDQGHIVAESLAVATTQNITAPKIENNRPVSTAKPHVIETKPPAQAPHKYYVGKAPLENKTVIEDTDKKQDPKVSPLAKNKQTDQKKLSKNDIYQLIDNDNTAKGRSLAAIKRAREKERRKLEQQNGVREKIYKEVILPDLISVGELANRMSERVADVIKELMKLGVIATSAQFIDADVAELIATTLGHQCKRVAQENVESLIELESNIDQNSYITRGPVVTVMGHVDHGKTSLLDALKESSVTLEEFGGITQHIGAYQIHTNTPRAITFIDTPGHEAFTAMRARGAKVTDIVVLVVAADDGIKTQTIEAISHAKAANLPIIVAINKIDKPDADIEKVKQELLQHDIISEDFGGDVMMVGVSATKKLNLLQLEDSILLLAEVLDLKANPNSIASGIVLEAKMTKNKGITSTLLIQNGTLHKGDFLVAGGTYCRVKNMFDYKANIMTEALPSMPVEVFGFDEMPNAGDKFVVTTEKKAKLIAENFATKFKENRIAQANKTCINELLLQSGKNIKELNLIVKADTHGSVEAIIESVNKIITDEVKIKILHHGVGAITESDVSLAEASSALILGFNVRANSNASTSADRNKVQLKYYAIIYDLLDELKQIVSRMLDPIIKEIFLGAAEVREVFQISKVGKIAGSLITKGLVRRNSKVRLLRENIVIFEGTLKTLKRFKEDAKEVKEGYECGIAINNYDNILVGDIIESYDVIEEKRVIQ